MTFNLLSYIFGYEAQCKVSDIKIWSKVSEL
jgi:hypothetical protein